MYKLVHAAKRPQYTWLHAHTNMPTKSVSILMDNTTAAVLDELQITNYVEFNGESMLEYVKIRLFNAMLCCP